MLDSIRQFFERNMQPVAGAADPLRPLQVATAALMIEMTRVDFAVKAVERAKVLAAMQSIFQLEAAQTEELLRLAEHEAHEATDYFQFTSLINKNLTLKQKERVIEYLWQVAYADGELNKYEEHLVRKIAELIYVPQTTFIAAKHRARRARN